MSLDFIGHLVVWAVTACGSHRCYICRTKKSFEKTVFLCFVFVLFVVVLCGEGGGGEGVFVFCSFLFCFGSRGDLLFFLGGRGVVGGVVCCFV